MKRSGSVPWLLILFFSGALIGLIMMNMIPENFFEDPLSLLVMLCIWPVTMLPAVIHEFGHLLFGILSGYRFVSFRVGSLTLVRTGGKMVFRRRRIRGTGGQCLLAPPDAEDHPYLLYLFGGVILNAIGVIASAILFFMTGKTGIHILSFIFGFICFYDAILNGIPCKPFGMPNDGYNALKMRSVRAVRRAVDLQLLINEAYENGLTPEKMPPEWFLLPPKEALNEPQAIVQLLNRADYLGAIGDKEGMADILRYALSLPDILPIHRLAAEAQLFIYFLLYQNADPLQLSGYDFSNLMSVIRMRGHAGVSAAAYAYFALLCRDLNTSRLIWSEFDKTVRNLPDGNRITAEREIAEVQKKVFDVFGQI